MSNKYHWLNGLLPQTHFVWQWKFRENYKKEHRVSLLPSSFPHNVFFLDKRCSKERGIKTTGEMEVLIARLELFDELGGGATKRLKGEEDVVVVETVGKVEGEKMLLELCKSGTLDEVLRALNVCGNPNVFNAEDESPPR